jgi:hypothetical protein
MTCIDAPTAFRSVHASTTWPFGIRPNMCRDIDLSCAVDLPQGRRLALNRPPFRHRILPRRFGLQRHLKPVAAARAWPSWWHRAALVP